MTNFVIINILISSLIHSNIGEVLSEKINDGSIAIDFIRPLKLKYYLIADNLGRNLYDLIFGCLPLCIFSAIILKFKLPLSFVNFIIFIITVLNGLILMSLINYILGLLGFWLHATWYVSWYLSALFRLFGGAIVPLWFYPKVLLDITKYLPFRFVTFEPIQIYLGKLSVNTSLEVILMQVIWIIIFVIIEKLMWYPAKNKVVIHGG
jgi:ABC-2 type transport system permease protein